MTIEEIITRLSTLEGRVDQIEIKLTTVEQHVGSTLDQFGGYKNRTAAELSLMRVQILGLISSVELLIIT
ncbi:hypothetical protein, partial [Pseudomonas viridiflava]